jgi:hypothetical protein
MTIDEVIAEATRFCCLVPQYPYRLEYGSFHDWSRRGKILPHGEMAWEAAPLFDAWKLTVSGLSLPRPGGVQGGRRERSQPISILSILIDDNARAYYSAVGR